MSRQPARTEHVDEVTRTGSRQYPLLAQRRPASRRINDGADLYVVTNRAITPAEPHRSGQVVEQAAIGHVREVAELDGLADSAVRSYIRACADPDAALSRLRVGATGNEAVIGGSTCTTTATLIAHCLLAFDQPRNRSKGRRLAVPDPQFGQLSDGTTHINFQSARHMQEVQREVLARSLPGALQRRRHVELLETGVRRNLIVELAYVTFDDSTQPQWILNVRDGISRWSVMMAAILGLLPGDVFTPAPNPKRRPPTATDDTSPVSMAKAIAEVVVSSSTLAAARNSKALVMAGSRRHTALVADYRENCQPSPAPASTTSAVCHAERTSRDAEPTAARSSDAETTGGFNEQPREQPADPPNENVWALVLRQFSVAPATVVLRAADVSGMATSVRGAVESIVADLHTGVDTWDGEDRQLFDSKRFLREMWADGNLPDVEAQLWLGLRPVGDVDLVFAPADGPMPSRHGALRFITHFYARMLGPELYEIVKDHLRNSVRGRYSFARTVEMLAPLANQHWDVGKPLSRLWAYQGGPVSEDVFRVRGLVPSCPDDYRALVVPALEGNPDARAELVLAGGVALMSDNVVTTTLIGGSGSATERLPFRGGAREIFDLLGSSHRGLMTLALAANHFDPSTPPSDARHRLVDLDTEDGIARDAGRTPLRLFERDIALILAEAKAQRETASSHPPSSDDAANGGDERNEADEAQLVRQLDALPGLVARVERTALEALDLRRRTGADDLGFTEEAADALAEKLTRASTTIARLIQ